jgi:hypothetical protein
MDPGLREIFTRLWEDPSLWRLAFFFSTAEHLNAVR